MIDLVYIAILKANQTSAHNCAAGRALSDVGL